MAKQILTPKSMHTAIKDILEDELGKQYADRTPYCLIVVTLKDGTTQEIIIKINPHNLYEVCDDIKKHGALTVVNEESGLYVPSNEIKHINLMKVTKEIGRAHV